jgi:hypothetical protein
VTALKQFFPLSDDWSLFFGVSAAFGPNASGRSNRSEVYGADLYLKYRSITRGSDSVLSLQSEWLYRRRQVPEDVLWDATSSTEALYRPSRRWAIAGRYEFGSPSYGSAPGIAPDPLDPSWIDHRHRFTASATFAATEFSRLRLQGSRDLPAWRQGIWAAFFAIELAAGAHGAHAF